MKFDQKMIITALIAFVIGGAVVGLIDANRPQPLFSSADFGTRDVQDGGDLNAKQDVQNIEAFLNEVSSELERAGINLDNKDLKLTSKQKTLLESTITRSFENNLPNFVSESNRSAAPGVCHQLGIVMDHIYQLHSWGYIPQHQIGLLVDRVYAAATAAGCDLSNI